MLTDEEQDGLGAMSIFLPIVYVPVWFSCSDAISAPYNDLLLLKKLELYKGVDARLAESALKALKRHLWYLSEQLVGLSILCDDVPDMTKSAMVENLEGPPKEGLKRVDGKTLPDINSLELQDFVTSKSMEVFPKLGIDTGFMLLEPSLWHESAAYRSAQKKARALRVVNDCAERGVALIQDYNFMVKDEKKKQNLLQVVENHRKKLRTVSKKALLTA